MSFFSYHSVPVDYTVPVFSSLYCVTMTEVFLLHEVRVLLSPPPGWGKKLLNLIVSRS